MAPVVIITGASRGIGAATALVLAKRGLRVVVSHRASAHRPRRSWRPSLRPAGKPWRSKPMSPRPMTSQHGG